MPDPSNPPSPVLHKAKTTSISAYQSIVDATESANFSIYAQQADLKAQIVMLNSQLSEVNARIALLEEGETAAARTAITALDLIHRGADRAVLKQLGIIK